MNHNNRSSFWFQGRAAVRGQGRRNSQYLPGQPSRHNILPIDPPLVPPPQQQQPSDSNAPAQTSNQGQQAQQHETTINPNNLERLINLMVVSIQKQDEMNQKLFNLINRLVPVVERIEQHLGRGATLNNETKLQRN
ncbi:unnamed protein product, partial [Rotaria sp. Silwood2]